MLLPPAPSASLRPAAFQESQRTLPQRRSREGDESGRVHQSPYGVNISCSRARALPTATGGRRPSRRTKRSWSTARIWSRTTCPDLPRKRQETLYGYGCPPLVRGATKNVRRWALSSSGDTTTHGLVLRIAPPRVGLRSTRNTSPRRILSTTSTATPCNRSASLSVRRAAGRRPSAAPTVLPRPILIGAGPLPG